MKVDELKSFLGTAIDTNENDDLSIRVNGKAVTSAYDMGDGKTVLVMDSV
ncbi:gp074 [Rhodococcus phage ReqiPoco6]|uniref:Gp074 n=1 Tax=Rhodococcus phage ReqiPoco6 TaxID=691964 RepID=D4P7U2_9CAUD|nr:gp074 [Rhodococcus phage ReqiPoco6]ADD81072.1 gp074 [Rhodococcus phage ReqiPoco6]